MYLTHITVSHMWNCNHLRRKTCRNLWKWKPNLWNTVSLTLLSLPLFLFFRRPCWHRFDPDSHQPWVSRYRESGRHREPARRAPRPSRRQWQWYKQQWLHHSHLHPGHGAQGLAPATAAQSREAEHAWHTFAPSRKCPLRWHRLCCVNG